MTKTYKDFEDYLQSIYAKDYTGTDDNMGDDFERWIEGFVADDWIAYGGYYGMVKEREGFIMAKDIAINTFN